MPAQCASGQQCFKFKKTGIVTDESVLASFHLAVSYIKVLTLPSPLAPFKLVQATLPQKTLTLRQLTIAVCCPDMAITSYVSSQSVGECDYPLPNHPSSLATSSP